MRVATGKKRNASLTQVPGTSADQRSAALPGVLGAKPASGENLRASQSWGSKEDYYL